MKISGESDATVRQIKSPEEEGRSKEAQSTRQTPDAAPKALEITRMESAGSASGASTTVKPSLFEPGPLPAPKNRLDPAQLQSTTDRLEKLHESTTIFDIFAVMTLLYLATMESRKASMQTARAALDAQVQQIGDQAQKLRDSADKAWKGALVSGIMGIAAGAVSIGGAAMGMRALKQDPTMLGQMTSGAWTGGAQGVSGMIQSGGGLGKAEYDKMSQYDQAKLKKHEAEALKESANREEALKIRDTMAEHLSSTLAAMRQILQSREQTTAKIFA